MIPPDRLVLLDTNVLLHLIRGKKAGQWIDEHFGLRERSERPLISIVTVGEILRIALRRTCGERRRQFLRHLLSELVIVDIGHGDILDKYGELGAKLEEIGRPIGENDLWIAATAAVRGAVLLTTDRDFDPLYPDYIDRIFIDPAQLPRDR